MKMLAVKMDGFKNLDKIDIVFSDINALVAINNYGKSNVMQAIDFATDFISANKESKRHMMAFKPGMPHNRNHLPRTFSTKFELEISLNDEKYLVDYSFAFE